MKKTGISLAVIGLAILFVITAGCADSAKKNVTITTDQTLTWVAGAHGAYQLDAEKGVPPYTWSIYPGSKVPAGFTLSPSGTLAGYAEPLPPTVPFITSQILAVVVDSDTPASMDKRNIQIRIVNQQTPTPTPTVFTTYDYPTLTRTTPTGTPTQTQPTSAPTVTKTASCSSGTCPITTSATGTPKGTGTTAGSGGSGLITGNYQIKIIYPGPWKGYYNDGLKHNGEYTVDISGSGDTIISISRFDGCLESSIVRGDIRFNGQQPATLQILRDGTIQKTQTTISAYSNPTVQLCGRGS